mmetsp:Transcript_44362/g.61691  ORF Transcript_44362/g.61691 Transcript_44362/m.61691 type:complete len:244 (+) Transcript_44362:508-1239(+)
MGHGGNGWVANAKAKGGHTLHTEGKLAEHVSVGQLEQGGRVHKASIVHGDHVDTVGEGQDAELLQQQGFGRSNLFVLLQQMHRVLDVNLSLDNLGGNVQGLQELGLGGLQSGGACRQVHVSRSQGSGLGSGGHTVSLQGGPQGGQVIVGEHQTNVSIDLVQQGEHLRVAIFSIGAQSLADQRVLAHQEGGFTTQLPAQVLELLGSNIVDGNQQNLGVLLHEVQKLGKVNLLAIHDEILEIQRV